MKALWIVAALSLAIALFGGCAFPVFRDFTGGDGGTASGGTTAQFTLSVSASTTSMYSFDSVTIENIDFAYIEDLTVTIVTPAGTSFRLIDSDAIRHLDGSYELMGSTAMGDYPSIEDAAQADGYTLPLNTITEDAFQAAESFSAAAGEDPNGTWTLRIENRHDYRDCTLDGFAIVIGYYE